jgi:hypothetical protein
MQALDELVARWRKNPDSESTLALCAHLGRSPQSDLMREVGNTAEAWHRENASVMLSVGRMYWMRPFLPKPGRFRPGGQARALGQRSVSLPGGSSAAPG